MPSNLIHMAMDSILLGEHIETIVDRMLIVEGITWKRNTGWSGVAGSGNSPLKKSTLSERVKSLIKKRMLREQTSGGATGGTAGNGGGTTSGSAPTNGSTSNGMNGNGHHHKGKLHGKGIRIGLGVAYAPDYCATKYSPGTAAYRRCRKKRDKTESNLHEVRSQSLQEKMALQNLEANPRDYRNWMAASLPSPG